MKKNIGIITVHNNTNYGANLQAFASCAYLNEQGYDCKLIDYTIPSHLKSTKLLSWLKVSWDNEKNKSLSRKVKLGLSLLLSAGWKGKRLKSFSNFRKNYIKITANCKDAKDVENLGLDAIVCGSDQIWNPTIMDGVNPIFFGNVDGIKTKISYAASVGKDKYSENEEKQVTELVKNLDYCSVREEQTAEYLSKVSNVNVQTVCDPVFLLAKQDYEKIIKKQVIKGDYVLLYSVIHNEEMTKVAKEYADKKGLKLIEICAGKDKNAGHKQILSYGPSEFLSAFKYANTIITNSFHGTAFSIIFEKDFYVFDNKHGGSRITNILSKAGLLERLIDKTINREYKDIDFLAVKENIKNYVQSSKEFLEKALNSNKENLAKEACVGCGACLSVCPKDAIRMITTKEGFLQAYIDKSKCIDCGLCKKVCPALNRVEKNEQSDRVYAFKANDEIRKESTSGGAFYALAKAVIDDGGVFYGAKLCNDFTVKHVRGETEEELKGIQGTKYTQSNLIGCYKTLISDLKSGKTVLFSGTPCQIDAINQFVRVKNLPAENLITVDIICHGVPSPKIYKEYIKWLEKELGSNVVKYYFRSKRISWRGNSCLAILQDGREIKNDKRLNGFMNLYYSNNITRECCYNCKYTIRERVADITISDYWGIENINKEFEDALGVSMIIVNTEKGNALFDSTAGQKQEGSLEGIKQPQLKEPPQKPTQRREFWQDYETGGLKVVLKKYGGVKKDSLKEKVYHLIRG